MITQTAKAIVDRRVKRIPHIGDQIIHPTHGLVELVGGQFWGTYGISNFWYWRKIGKRGKPIGKLYSGYGGWITL